MTDKTLTPTEAAAGDVTRISASLPTVDMEIVRHDAAGAGEEAVTITLRARPGFEAMANALLPSMMALPSMMGGAHPMAGMPSLPAAMNPFSAFAALGAGGDQAAVNIPDMAQAMQEMVSQWQEMTQQAWAPWIKGWETAMGSMTAGMPVAGLGALSNPFAEMMAQMAGVPLCAAGAKPKG